MDSMAAFVMGQANRGKPLMVFDWDAAAALIRECGVQTASAGLEGDWDWTGGDILRDGKPVEDGDSYTFLASTWATPQLCLDDEIVACWRYEDDVPGWDANTRWPESARRILSAEVAS